jgi:beta-lactamase class A
MVREDHATGRADRQDDRMTLDAQLAELFAQAGVDAAFHAVDLANGTEVGHRPDEQSVMASVFKLPVLVALVRAADAGLVDLAEQVTVPVTGRAAGPTGLSMMSDPVTMSLRDLARSMIVLSDNAATDVVVDAIGLPAVKDTLAALGLHRTQVLVHVNGLFDTIVEDAGLASFAEFPAAPPLDELLRWRAMRPADTNSTTPRDMTRLLSLVARDEAASPDGCALVRSILAQQVWPHRLASGFPEDDVLTAGKTGTLPRLRNEVGLVSYPDGGRYAVACFTWAHAGAVKNPAADAVIGRAARLAVDALRA